MNKWNPSQEQKSGHINKTFEFIIDELNDLQVSLDCPDDFIYELLENIKIRWSDESCYAKARQHKRDNPKSY